MDHSNEQVGLTLGNPKLQPDPMINPSDHNTTDTHQHGRGYTNHVDHTQDHSHTDPSYSNMAHETPNSKIQQLVTQFNQNQPHPSNYLDPMTVSTICYPDNLPPRSYQVSIVKTCVSYNTLVCLPTGLGKTLIAAAIMWNFFRWFPQGQIIFLAPTKPLVTQQCGAVIQLTGIPTNDIAVLTGEQKFAKKRDEIWESHRVVFSTPQTLSNDLTAGKCNGKRIVCLIIDEAHKATGNYAYVKIVEHLKLQNIFPRIVALSATPGISIIKVNTILRNLLISRIEVRTEDDDDVKPYIHRKNIHAITIPLTAILKKIDTSFSDLSRKPLLILSHHNILNVREAKLDNVYKTMIIQAKQGVMIKNHSGSSSSSSYNRPQHQSTQQYASKPLPIHIALANLTLVDLCITSLKYLREYSITHFYLHLLNSFENNKNSKISFLMEPFKNQPPFQNLLSMSRAFIKDVASNLALGLQRVALYKSHQTSNGTTTATSTSSSSTTITTSSEHSPPPNVLPHDQLLACGGCQQFLCTCPQLFSHPKLEALSYYLLSFFMGVDINALCFHTTFDRERFTAVQKNRLFQDIIEENYDAVRQNLVKSLDIDDSIPPSILPFVSPQEQTRQKAGDQHQNKGQDQSKGKGQQQHQDGDQPNKQYPISSRVIIFTVLRSSVGEIYQALSPMYPIIRPVRFIGQSNTTSSTTIGNDINDTPTNTKSKSTKTKKPTTAKKTSRGFDDPLYEGNPMHDFLDDDDDLLSSHHHDDDIKLLGLSGESIQGMTQQEQQQVLKDFVNGTYNVLIATTIAEEGLDIGDVDLIICYDTTSSPIRLIQRRGRTGRVREGSIIALLSQGNEEQSYYNGMRRIESMYTMLKRGVGFNLIPRFQPPPMRFFTPIAKGGMVTGGVGATSTNTTDTQPQEPRKLTFKSLYARKEPLRSTAQYPPPQQNPVTSAPPGSTDEFMLPHLFPDGVTQALEYVSVDDRPIKEIEDEVLGLAPKKRGKPAKASSTSKKQPTTAKGGHSDDKDDGINIIDMNSNDVNPKMDDDGDDNSNTNDDGDDLVYFHPSDGSDDESSDLLEAIDFDNDNDDSTIVGGEHAALSLHPPSTTTTTTTTTTTSTTTTTPATTSTSPCSPTKLTTGGTPTTTTPKPKTTRKKAASVPSTPHVGSPSPAKVLTKKQLKALEREQMAALKEEKKRQQQEEKRAERERKKAERALLKEQQRLQKLEEKRLLKEQREAEKRSFAFAAALTTGSRTTRTPKRKVVVEVAESECSEAEHHSCSGDDGGSDDGSNDDIVTPLPIDDVDTSNHHPVEDNDRQVHVRSKDMVEEKDKRVNTSRKARRRVQPQPSTSTVDNPPPPPLFDVSESSQTQASQRHHGEDHSCDNITADRHDMGPNMMSDHVISSDNSDVNHPTTSTTETSIYADNNDNTTPNTPEYTTINTTIEDPLTQINVDKDNDDKDNGDTGTSSNNSYSGNTGAALPTNAGLDQHSQPPAYNTSFLFSQTIDPTPYSSFHMSYHGHGDIGNGGGDDDDDDDTIPRLEAYHDASPANILQIASSHHSPPSQVDISPSCHYPSYQSNNIGRSSSTIPRSISMNDEASINNNETLYHASQDFLPSTHHLTQRQSFDQTQSHERLVLSHPLGDWDVVSDPIITNLDEVDFVVTTATTPASAIVGDLPIDSTPQSLVDMQTCPQPDGSHSRVDSHCVTVPTHQTPSKKGGLSLPDNSPSHHAHSTHSPSQSQPSGSDTVVELDADVPPPSPTTPLIHSPSPLVAPLSPPSITPDSKHTKLIAKTNKTKDSRKVRRSRFIDDEADYITTKNKKKQRRSNDIPSTIQSTFGDSQMRGNKSMDDHNDGDGDGNGDDDDGDGSISSDDCMNDDDFDEEDEDDGEDLKDFIINDSQVTPLDRSTSKVYLPLLNSTKTKRVLRYDDDDDDNGDDDCDDHNNTSDADDDTDDALRIAQRYEQMEQLYVAEIKAEEQMMYLDPSTITATIPATMQPSSWTMSTLPKLPPRKNPPSLSSHQTQQQQQQQQQQPSLHPASLQTHPISQPPPTPSTLSTPSNTPHNTSYNDEPINSTYIDDNEEEKHDTTPHPLHTIHHRRDTVIEPNSFDINQVINDAQQPPVVLVHTGPSPSSSPNPQTDTTTQPMTSLTDAAARWLQSKTTQTSRLQNLLQQKRSHLLHPPIPSRKIDHEAFGMFQWAQYHYQQLLLNQTPGIDDNEHFSKISIFFDQKLAQSVSPIIAILRSSAKLNVFLAHTHFLHGAHGVISKDTCIFIFTHDQIYTDTKIKELRRMINHAGSVYSKILVFYQQPATTGEDEMGGISFKDHPLIKSLEQQQQQQQYNMSSVNQQNTILPGPGNYQQPQHGMDQQTGQKPPKSLYARKKTPQTPPPSHGASLTSPTKYPHGSGQPAMSSPHINQDSEASFFLSLHSKTVGDRFMADLYSSPHIEVIPIYPPPPTTHANTHYQVNPPPPLSQSDSPEHQMSSHILSYVQTQHQTSTLRFLQTYFNTPLWSCLDVSTMKKCVDQVAHLLALQPPYDQSVLFQSATVTTIEPTTEPTPERITAMKERLHDPMYLLQLSIAYQTYSTAMVGYPNIFDSHCPYKHELLCLMSLNIPFPVAFVLFSQCKYSFLSVIRLISLMNDIDLIDHHHHHSNTPGHVSLSDNDTTVSSMESPMAAIDLTDDDHRTDQDCTTTANDTPSTQPTDMVARLEYELQNDLHFNPHQVHLTMLHRQLLRLSSTRFIHVDTPHPVFNISIRQAQSIMIYLLRPIPRTIKLLDKVVPSDSLTRRINNKPPLIHLDRAGIKQHLKLLKTESKKGSKKKTRKKNKKHENPATGYRKIIVKK